MMYDVVLSKRFKKDLRKLLRKDPRLKKKIERQIELLSVEPDHKSLRLHKLSGTNNWSISITMEIRLLFTIRGGRVLCIRIGSHDEVY